MDEDRPRSAVTRFLQASPNEQRQLREWKWEHQIVARLLTFYGLARYRRDIEQREYELTGNYRLSLPAFHVQFSEVPFYLVAAVPTKLEADLTLVRLMTRFEKTRVLDLYDKYVDIIPPEIGDGQPYGLVIPWPYIRNGLILHDMTVDVNNPGTCVMFCQENRCLTLELFDNFLGRQASTLDGREE